MRRLYDDNLYRFDQPQPSYWEATAGDIPVPASPLDGTQSCDVAVIGGGYTGLSAALHLARDYDIDVRVLEAGHIGWGASGRNGGFCSIGGTGLHRADLIRRCGEENAKDYYRSQREAVELVRSVVADECIDVDAQGDAEVEVAHTPRAFERLEKDCRVLTDTLGSEAEIIGADEFRERYYDSTEQHGALISRPTFGLHPLRYCRGLANAAALRGATLHDRSEVIEWTKSDDGLHRLRSAAGNLLARRVVFATNGFMPEHLRTEFSARTIPVISAIVVTRPLSEAERSAHSWHNPHPTINARRILNYYRMLPDGRFLFGGRGLSSGSVRDEKQTYGRIVATMRRIWPQWSNIEIEYRWHGLICFTASLYPSIGELEEDDSVYFGFGYHGNGVNTATWTGKQLADWIGRGSAPKLPGIVRGLSGRYPLPRLRRKYLQVGIAVSSLLDRRA